MARKNTWTTEQLALLGTDTDKAIANRLGKKHATVVKARIDFGIAAFDQPKGRQHKWTDEEISWLGELPDTVIAKRLGISRNAVINARNRRNIGAHGAVIGFDELIELSQPDFYKELCRLYGGKLTYKKLAEMTFVSVSRCQKWFAPGAGQEPLSTAYKHHFYLAVLFYSNKNY